MKRISVLISVTVFIVSNLLGQAPDTSWTRTFNGSDASEEALAIVETSDGGYVAIGSIDETPMGDMLDPPNDTRRDIYLVKYNSSGEVVFSKSYGGANEDVGHDILVTPDDGFLIFGHTYSYGVGAINDYSGGNSNFWLIKTDNLGIVEWDSTYGTSDDDYGVAIVESGDGGYFLSGETTPPYPDWNFDMRVIKINSTGEVIWNYSYGGDGYERGVYSGLDATADGGCIVVASTNSWGAGSYDGWLLKIDADGNEEWSQTIGESGYDRLNSVKQIPATGDYIVTGKLTPNGQNNSDILLAHIANSGTINWQRTFGGNYEDEGKCVIPVQPEGFIITGGITTDGYNSVTASDLSIIKTDAMGVEEWSLLMGDALAHIDPQHSSDIGNSVIQTLDSGFMIAGKVGVPFGQKDDFWLIKLAPYLGPIWHVSTEATGFMDGSSNSPFATIQAGIDAAIDGNTVLVQPGTYLENINFNGKDITVGSLFLSTQDTAYIAQTVIDGNQDGTTVTFPGGESNSAILSGVSVVNGSALHGGGIQCSSSPTLQNLIIKDNNAFLHGGGLRITSGSPVISNVEIIQNVAGEWGAGIHCSGSSSPRLQNVLIANNTSNQFAGGLYVFAGASMNLEHVTITENTGSYGGGGIYIEFNSEAQLLNSIVWNNYPPSIVDPEGGSISASYSNIQGGLDGSGNIDIEPMFSSVENMDYQLSKYSQCIGAGLDTNIVLGTDIAGNDRPTPSGSNPDMGAYENQYALPQHIPITIHVPGDYSTIQAGLNAAESMDTVLVAPGTYLENISFPSTNNIHLIGQYGSDQTAIDGNASGSVMIFNNAGALDSSTVIQGITIRNGGGVVRGGGIALQIDSPKFLDCIILDNVATNQGGGVYAYQSDAIFESCKILSNDAYSEGGGVYAEDCGLSIRVSEINENVAHASSGYTGGGGLRLQSSHITLFDVTIASNSTNNQGGGIYSSFVYSNPTSTFDKVKIIDNTAHDGGGIALNNDSPIISNSSIIGNTAIENAGGIGCYYETTAPILSNVIIAMNSANNGGGLFAVQLAAPHLSNVALVNNSASVIGGAAYYIGYSEGEMINVTVDGNIAGNFPGVYSTDFSYPSFHESNFMDNSLAIHNGDNLVTLDADSCWWGDFSGPYHITGNSTGLGETVEGAIDIEPWLAVPNIDAPPIPAKNISISGNGNDFITINWDSSLLSDFAGYNLYYDTDESGYPYENSIDVGVDTTFTLSGLDLGTGYFLAVTVYDTDGNESWYSSDVTGTTRIMEVQNLDIAGEEHLYHLVTHDPLVTFDYFDSMSETQTNYHLQISTDSTFQANIIWDSGEVASDATSNQYTGGALLDGVKYYLRAKVASGTFWSGWETLAFGMNTEPSLPVQLSLIGDEITTSDVLLEISNSSDAEEDNLTYDFRLYDATQAIQLDSAIAVDHDPDGTEWEVTTALVDNSQHWWTVQAYDGYEYSDLAGPESFLINFENDDPAGFDLTSPLLDESIINQSPLFTWNPAVDPDPLDTVRYVLYLDTPDPGVETFYPGIDTSFQLDYNLEDNTTYHWKVVAHDLNDSETESNGGYQSFTVNTANDLPEYFELLYPVWDEMVTNLQPEFLWEASNDPDDETIVMRSKGKGRLVEQPGSGNTVDVITGYDFYLSTDSMLTEVVPVEVIGTSYSPTEDLLENQTYYWAVSAIDDSGGVTFTDTASFWTNSENSHPAEFTLLTPVDDTESILTPTFTWTMSEDADLQDTLNYTLRYGTDVFSLMDIPNGSSTQFTVVEPFMDNTEYLWQVVAEDISGATFVTEFSSFFVNSENDDPGLFSLIAPDSAAWITNSDLMLVWEPSTDLEGADIEYVIHMGADNESLNPVDTISVNYYALNALEDGYYYWQVEALDNIGGTQFSETWSFLINVQNDPPGPFSLTFPAADLVLTEQQPIFTWEASSSGDAGDHTSYRVELGNSAESMGVVYEGDSTFYTPELALEDNSVYYWRVTAIDLAFATTVNEGGYQSFIVNTVNDAPSMAELISPDSVMVLSDIPTFSWNASTDVDPYDSLSYELHWWTDVSEMDSILTTATSVSPETPLADDNLQYFWNVITMDANGGIAHSEEKTFWVDFMPEVPASFTLLGPDSASAGNGTRPELTWAEAIDPDPFDAVHYSVAVATDSLMENVIYEEVAHVEVTIPEIDLENDTRYYWQVTAIDEDSLTTTSSIWTFDVGYVAIDQYAQVPTEFVLDQNYPNPFNPSTTIRYGLPEETNVSLVIYDVRGQVVQTLESGHQSAGWYDVVWNGHTTDGHTISTGIYFARLVAGDYSQVIKMLYLK